MIFIYMLGCKFFINVFFKSMECNSFWAWLLFCTLISFCAWHMNMKWLYVFLDCNNTKRRQKIIQSVFYLHPIWYGPRCLGWIGCRCRIWKIFWSDLIWIYILTKVWSVRMRSKNFWVEMDCVRINHELIIAFEIQY